MRLLFLIAMPFIELYTFIVVGGEIGAGMVILLILLSAFLGVTVIKLQRQRSFAHLSSSLMSGDAPVFEVLSSFALLLGGMLLIIPGFITDALGLLFLFRPTRNFFIRMLANNYASLLKRWVAPHNARRPDQMKSPFIYKEPTDPSSEDTTTSRTIEGEYTHYDEKEKEKE